MSKLTRVVLGSSVPSSPVVVLPVLLSSTSFVPAVLSSSAFSPPPLIEFISEDY